MMFYFWMFLSALNTVGAVIPDSPGATFPYWASAATAVAAGLMAVREAVEEAIAKKK